MKRLLNSLKVAIVSILALFLLSACSITNYKSGILFSDKPFVGENFEQKILFRTNERVYFGIFTKKGFKDDIIQYQLLKKDEKTPVGGYKIVYSNRAEVKHEHYFTDYIVPQGKGLYYIQVFELHNLQQPIVVGNFRVCD